MNFLIKIWIAFILDLIFGDPEKITHPVQIIGKMITFLEKKLYGKKGSFVGGAVLGILVVTSTFLVMYGFVKLTKIVKVLQIFEIYLMYTIFSVKSLAREGKRVYKILKLGNLKVAREKLSYLVSRDTEKMDKVMIIRSTMETISENMVDGVIAPMFYMFVGGLPLAMVYKAINTLDSMVGYKNEKYAKFGTFSAKLDDVVNFIPARISGIFITAASYILRYNYKNAWKIFKRDRKNHASPNSGHSESAVAGALGVQFGGKVSYFGKEVEKPTIGDKIKEFRLEDIKKNILLMYVTSFVAIFCFSIIHLIINGMFNGVFNSIAYFVTYFFVNMLF